MRSPARPPRRRRGDQQRRRGHDGTRAGSYALLTHSLPPSAKSWCFQIGTVAFMLIDQGPAGVKRLAPVRAETATTTASSPTPARRAGARRQCARTSKRAAIFSATCRSSAAAEGWAL